MAAEAVSSRMGAEKMSDSTAAAMSYRLRPRGMRCTPKTNSMTVTTVTA